MADKYLFAFFTGDSNEGEQVRFSLSEDGMHWNDLNNGEPILVNNIGTKGARDPFILRSPWEGKDGNPKFYLIATDLRIENGFGWSAAVTTGSRDILVFTSDDLVNWVGPRAATVGVEGAGCVWAPEAIYDGEKDKILVYWASNIKLEGDKEPKQRIYASYTKDFVNFDEPFIYLEKESHVIDSTIIHIANTDLKPAVMPAGYYRYTKDETTKYVVADYSESLTGKAFRPIESECLNNLPGVEGPEIYRLNDGRWCLIVDRFATNGGYLPLLSDNLYSGEFTQAEDCEYDMGEHKKRHGGIMVITEAEYKLLMEKWGTDVTKC